MELTHKSQILYAKCDCGQYEEFETADVLPKNFTRVGNTRVLKCKACDTMARMHFKHREVRPQSKLQKIATARNYLSFVLAGFPKPLNEKYMTEEELLLWDNIKCNVEQMQNIHRKGDKYFGLKVKGDG